MSEQPEIHRRKKKGEVASRLGRKPVSIPDGVTVSIKDSAIEVQGKNGKLNWTLPSLVTAKTEGKAVVVSPIKYNNETKAYHGLSRKLIFNMIEGVTKGFEKKLVIEGVGFRAQVAGEKLTMTLGFSHPALYSIPKGIKIAVTGKGQNELSIQGIDKQLVGQAAAEIRGIKKPEPYKGTGIRYENEVVHRKAGKSAVGSGTGGKK